MENSIISGSAPEPLPEPEPKQITIIGLDEQTNDNALSEPVPTQQITISEDMLNASEQLLLSKMNFVIKRITFDYIVVDMFMGVLPVTERAQLQYTEKEFVFKGVSPLVDRELEYNLTSDFTNPVNVSKRNLYRFYWKKKFNIV